jgi:SPP1 gp7 family putative phage head morphogenesis protein
VRIGDELWQLARSALAEGLAKGESIPQLAQRVRDAAGVAAPRATTIARTEVIGASNAGSIEGMRTLAASFGIEDMKKTWIATRDNRTRPTHLAVNGKEVGLDETFTVGGWPADRPHDPLLPADETVNCRCTLGYAIPEEKLSTVASTFHLPGRHNQKTHGHGFPGSWGPVDRDHAVSMVRKHVAMMHEDEEAPGFVRQRIVSETKKAMTGTSKFYASGSNLVMVHSAAKVKDEDLAALMEDVDQLDQRFHIRGGLNLSIDSPAHIDPSGRLAATTKLGTGMMRISDHVVANNGYFGHRGRDQRLGVLAHEWGHAQDRGDFRHDITKDQLYDQLTSKTASRYARTDATEAFAEAFADFNTTPAGKDFEWSSTADYATTFGWEGT